MLNWVQINSDNNAKRYSSIIRTEKKKKKDFLLDPKMFNGSTNSE